MPEPIELKPPPQHDLDGSNTVQVMTSYLSLERLQSRRSLRAHVMAALSVPLGFCVYWPELVGPRARNVMAGGWLVCALFTAQAVLGEWAHRRRTQALAAAVLEGTPRS